MKSPPATGCAALGAVAAALMTLLPVAGSVDILNYAVYGRINPIERGPTGIAGTHHLVEAVRSRPRWPPTSTGWPTRTKSRRTS
ncbi:hypothetical protein ACQP1W_43975 [Spirillospora sp. CA-255316]